MLLIGSHSSRPGVECALRKAQKYGAAPLQLSSHLSVGIANKVHWRIKNKGTLKGICYKVINEGTAFWNMT